RPRVGGANDFALREATRFAAPAELVSVVPMILHWRPQSDESLLPPRPPCRAVPGSAGADLTISTASKLCGARRFRRLVSRKTRKESDETNSSRKNGVKA